MVRTDEQVGAPTLRKEPQMFQTRQQIEAAGFVPGWHGEHVEVGDEAVAFGHGQWRLGKVTKVTRSFVWVEYTAPSTKRVHEAQGDRLGRRTDLYVRPARVVAKDGGATLETLRMLNRPRYDWLVRLADWLRDGDAYPRSYTFEQAVTEHLQRRIITDEEARFLRLIETERRLAAQL